MWIVYAVLAAIVWGLDYALAERIMRNRVSVLALIGLQLAIGAIVLVPVAIYRGGLRELRAAWELPATHRLLPLAIVSFAAGNLLIALSVQQKNATVATLIEVAYPLAVVFFSWALFGELYLTRGVVVGGSLIILGVVVIYAWG